MPITYTKPAADAGGTWHAIKGHGGDFEILIREPNYGQLAADADALSPDGMTERRTRAVVADWRGVVDEQGKPEPFDVDKLLHVLASDRRAFHQVTALVFKAFSLPGEDERKNSDVPPSASSAAVESGTRPSDATSPSGDAVSFVGSSTSLVTS